MATRPIPASLAKRGLTGITDNLPPGAELDVVRDFVRIFRPEIEKQMRALRAQRRPALAPATQGAQP